MQLHSSQTDEVYSGTVPNLWGLRHTEAQNTLGVPRGMLPQPFKLILKPVLVHYILSRLKSTSHHDVYAQYSSSPETKMYTS